MSNRKADRVVQLLVDVMEDIRRKNADLCRECEIEYRDPLADVRIVKADDSKKVTLTYDGAGYDYFTYDGWMEFDGHAFNSSEKTREKISEGLRKIDKNLNFEDENNWSFSVYL